MIHANDQPLLEQGFDDNDDNVNLDTLYSARGALSRVDKDHTHWIHQTHELQAW